MDNIFRTFLDETLKKALEISAQSDTLEIRPEPYSPSMRYLLLFNGIEHLRMTSAGVVEKAIGRLPVEIRFPLDYLRSTDTALYLKIATLLDPHLPITPHQVFFHPNYDPVTGVICLGNRFSPGTSLTNLIFHVYDIITYRNFSLHEADALDWEACRYLREHPGAVSSLKSQSLRNRRHFTLSVFSGTSAKESG